MSYEFYPGQRVVALEDSPADQPPPHGAKGAVYTICNVYVAYDDGELMLELLELPFPGGDDWWPGFIAKYFRPLDEKRLDVFRAHLNRVPSPEKEPA